MLKSGILNPAINSLLSRVRHTNTLVIADRGFPYWPHIETIDISLTDDIPRVMDVLAAIQANFVIGRSSRRRSFSPPILDKQPAPWKMLCSEFRSPSNLMWTSKNACLTPSD